MKYAIMLSIDTTTGTGIDILLEAVEASYVIMSGVAVGTTIFYVLTGAKHLPSSVISKAVVAP